MLLGSSPPGPVGECACLLAETRSEGGGPPGGHSWVPAQHDRLAGSSPSSAAALSPWSGAGRHDLGARGPQAVPGDQGWLLASEAPSLRAQEGQGRTCF